MSFHLDFELKACAHSHLLCCIYSRYHPAFTMHRCSLTQGPFVFHQDLQRSADCVSFSHFPPCFCSSSCFCVSLFAFLMHSLLSPLSYSSDTSTAVLPVPCPRAQDNICKEPSSYGASRCFSSLCVATIWKKTHVFVGENISLSSQGWGQGITGSWSTSADARVLQIKPQHSAASNKGQPDHPEHTYLLTVGVQQRKGVLWVKQLSFPNSWSSFAPGMKQ